MSRYPRKPPAYRLHKATGQAAVTIAGKYHYLGKHGSPESHEKYARLIAEHQATKAAGGKATLPPPPKEGASIGQLALAYKAFAESYYVNDDGSPSSELDLVKRAVRCVRLLYGTTPAAEFGPLRLKAVRESMIANGWARGVINRHIHRIKRFIKWAVSEELVPASLHHGLAAVSGLKRGRTEARETEPIKPVPDAWIEAVLPFAPEPVADLMRLQLLCGARPSELLAMRGTELDQSGPVWILRPRRHKTQHHGHQRTIYLGPQAQAVLARWLKDDPEAYCFSPMEAEAERNAKKRADRKTPRWPSHCRREPKARRAPLRDRYSVGTFRQAIHRACDRADAKAHKEQPDVAADTRIIPRFGPHRLRHNAATNIRRQFGAELARVILGHSGLDATAIYAEADAAQAVAAMAKIG